MNRVYKLTPVSQYDVDGVENWLEDMALQGLRLKTFRSLFCTFTREPSARIRYRVEPCKTRLDEYPPQDMLDLYRDFGWDYEGRVSDTMLLFSTRDPAAPEPHSDPELQGERWDKLRRSMVRGCLLNLLLALLLLVLCLLMLFGEGQPVLALLTTPIVPFIAVTLVCLLLLLPQSFAELRYITSITRRLKAGVSLEHRAFYPKRRLRTLAVFLVTLAVWGVLLVAQYLLPLTGGQMEPLDQLDAFHPLSIASLEGEDFQSSHYVTQGIDYANFCRRERYLLCRDQWQVVQTGEGNRSDNIWVRMDIQWYHLPGALLAVPLAKEQLDHAMELSDDIWWASGETGQWTTDYFREKGADFLAVAHRADSPFQAAAVVAGDKVALVRYTGHGDLADHLEEIAAMVGYSEERSGT